MNHGFALEIAFVWLAALGGGGAIAIGVIEVLAGRVVINLRRLAWTRNETTAIGFLHLLLGLGVAIYTLIGLLVTVPRQPWGFLVSFPFLVFLVVIGSVLVSLELKAMRRPRL